jgi:hypothetical protein
MPAAIVPAPRKPSPALLVTGALLAIGGLAGLALIVAIVSIDDPRMQALEINLGLAPAAALSLSAQLALLIGLRMIWVGWPRRRGSRSAGRADD